jgi:hypothetical protein
MRVVVRRPYPELDRQAFGITTDASLGWRDFGALTVRADVVRGGGRTASALYGGARLGSYPAVVATAAYAALIAAFIAAISGTDY